MNDKPLTPVSRSGGAMFAFRLYVPALKKHIAKDTQTSSLYKLWFGPVETVEKQVSDFFSKPGNAIGMAVYRASPYYQNPMALWRVLR